MCIQCHNKCEVELLASTWYSVALNECADPILNLFFFPGEHLSLLFSDVQDFLTTYLISPEPMQDYCS